MANKQGSPAAIAVWRATKAAATPQTAIELTRATGLPMTTVHRVTTALATANLLSRGICRNEHDQRVTSFAAVGTIDAVVAKFGPQQPLRPARAVVKMRPDPTASSYFGAGVARIPSVWALATV